MTDERQLLDEFKREIMSEFIIMCKGNDFKKLTLLKIGDTIDRIYEKYTSKSKYETKCIDFCSHGKRKEN